MIGFPHVDPIPLPAPIWLFKLLDIVTLALHFVAMQMLVGGLLIAVLLNLFGKSASSRAVSAGIARRLTIVMTYVINLGIPPLLFAQVLYGRALYTSSVLIGVYWIGVIAALTFAYWLLYRFAAGLEAGKRSWWVGLIAWITIGCIADVYTNNMTLMLRPEVWQKMYAASSLGTHLAPYDPSILARLAYVLSGGFLAAGLWMIYLASRQSFSLPDRQFLSRLGGVLAAGTGLSTILAGRTVYSVQSPVVQQLIAEHALYRLAGWAWLAVGALVILFSAWVALRRPVSALSGWLAAVLGFLFIATATLYRDGIRDMTLLSKGFDVWDRVVVTNWSVVGLFLALFILGLAVVGWLISVVSRADRVIESEVAG
jgi:hypothetical protein